MLFNPKGLLLIQHLVMRGINIGPSSTSAANQLPGTTNFWHKTVLFCHGAQEGGTVEWWIISTLGSV